MSIPNLSSRLAPRNFKNKICALLIFIKSVVRFTYIFVLWRHWCVLVRYISPVVSDYFSELGKKKNANEQYKFFSPDGITPKKRALKYGGNKLFMYFFLFLFVIHSRLVHCCPSHIRQKFNKKCLRRKQFYNVFEILQKIHNKFTSPLSRE